MTYTTPQLSLIGQATGVVLGGNLPPQAGTTFDGIIKNGIRSYDAVSLLDAEW